MADQSSSGRGQLAVIAVVIVLLVVGVWMATRSPADEAPAEDRETGRVAKRAPSATKEPDRDDAPPRPVSSDQGSNQQEDDDNEEGRPLPPALSPLTDGMSKMAQKAVWRPPRPLRFVARYGDGRRSADEARQHAESVRRRFLAGEDPYPLIQDLSDPPLGIPRELLKRWENLDPTEASPVIPIDNGFALFFGAPAEPPSQADGGRE